MRSRKLVPLDCAMMGNLTPTDDRPVCVVEEESVNQSGGQLGSRPESDSCISEVSNGPIMFIKNVSQ